MFYYLFAGAALLSTLLILSCYRASNARNKIIKLFAASKNISSKIYSHTQLSGLPEPVQKYFRLVLQEGQPYISYVNLTHSGEFKTTKDKAWNKIEGEEYFTTENPGFIWKGTTDVFTATDQYINGQGKLKVTLFSIYNIVNATGGHYNQGELLRWLGESVWFPTNLLPGKHLKWSAIDDHSARVDFSFKGLAVHYLVRFNEKGEMVQLETQRYMGDQLQTWIGKLYGYKVLQNVLIPTNIEASWKLPEGEFTYAKFSIDKIEYE